MPSISARAASSSTTRTRPRLGPFGVAVGGTGPFCALAAGKRPTPRGEPLSDRSVPVVVALVRTLDRHADVVGLHLGQLGQLHAEGVEVQPGHVLVELLR